MKIKRSSISKNLNLRNSSKLKSALQNMKRISQRCKSDLHRNIMTVDNSITKNIQNVSIIRISKNKPNFTLNFGKNLKCIIIIDKVNDKYTCSYIKVKSTKAFLDNYFDNYDCIYRSVNFGNPITYKNYKTRVLKNYLNRGYLLNTRSKSRQLMTELLNTYIQHNTQ